MPKDRKAVLPVMSINTRLLIATNSIPKEMLPPSARPLTQAAVDKARAAGSENFIFGVAYNNGGSEFGRTSGLQHLNETEQTHDVDMWTVEEALDDIFRERQMVGLRILIVWFEILNMLSQRFVRGKISFFCLWWTLF
jgi:UTP-glucose-1-phosphate uridylyltransferase